MTNQIRLTKKIDKEITEILVELHLNKGERFKPMSISQSKAVEIAMTAPKTDLNLVMLIFKCYLFSNINDLRLLEAYLIEKFGYDTMRPYMEL